jgi:diguanylate cyclase (GGDEF)-like protein
VLFVDLDGFKAVNDAHGHAEGDRVLGAFAARLAGGLRGGDTAARIGGDEFVVLCEDIAGEDEARAIAARLLDQVGIPASMGIALASAADEDAQAVVRDADAAMYAVKRRGGAGLEVAGQPGRPRNASTTRGSNWEPEPSAIVSRARSTGQASL